MRLLKIFILTVLFSRSSIALPPNPITKICALFFRDLARRQQMLKPLSQEVFSKEVSIIWYPKSYFFLMGHTALKVGDDVYNLTVRIRRPHDFSAAKAAAEKGSFGFFQFKLAVTPSEFKRLESTLAKHKILLQMCTGGACKVLRDDTGIDIPYPFSHAPSLNAAYLALGKAFGSSRVKSIEYVGKSAWKSLISPGYADVWIIATSTGLAAGLIIELISETGKLIKLFVPVSVEENISSNDR